MLPLVFLVHGFRSDSASMDDIALAIKKDFTPISVEVPLAFSSLDNAFEELKRIVSGYLSSDNLSDVYFIGHSTGGILIRMLMNEYQFSSITKMCLFIATPNNGTELADLHQALPDIIRSIHLPLKSLTKEGINRLNLVKPYGVIYGAIAGSESMPATSMFFPSPNDGLVSINSVLMEELNDFIVLPYTHFEIHHQFSTCEIIKYFLENASFPQEIKEINKLDLSQKFRVIIENGHTNQLCRQLRGNIDFVTAGGLVFWKELSSCNGWRLQQNNLSQHIRILNPDNIRKGFGSYKKIEKAIDAVCSRIKIEESADSSFSNSGESSSGDITAKLRELRKLHQEGLIDKEEYEKKKRDLLNRM